MRRRVGDEIEFLWKRVSTSNWESECEEKDERKREEGDETRRDASELTDQPTDRSSPPPRLPTAPFSLTFNLSSNLQAQAQSHQLQNQPKRVSSVLRFSPFRRRTKGTRSTFNLQRDDFSFSLSSFLLLTASFIPSSPLIPTFNRHTLAVFSTLTLPNLRKNRAVSTTFACDTPSLFLRFSFYQFSCL